jgi:uncharacterized protein YbjT (DUF2867 family)
LALPSPRASRDPGEAGLTGATLVIGGRSKIGAALIDLLLQAGHDVRALVRSRESGSALAGGVELVFGDLAERGTLDAAMRGAERVFLLSSPHTDAMQWHRNAIEAARDAGVGLLVRSSILGADATSPAEFLRMHGQSDRDLEHSGLDYAIVRPNLFMQNVPESTIPSIDAHGKFYVNAGDARISMVDTRDVAAVAAAILSDVRLAGACYDVTGGEALSYGDVAAKLTAALHRPIACVDVPDDAVRRALTGYGVGRWLADALVELYQNYRRSGTDGYAADVSDTVQRLTGRPARTLDELLSELR